MNKMSVIIILGLLLLAIPLSVHATTVSGTNVQVTLLNQNPDPVQSGKYVEVRWKVENTGGSATNDFTFELKPKYPFSLDPGVDPVTKLGKIDSYQVGNDAYVVYYKLRVDENAIQGSYDLEYRYSYDGGNSWFEKSDPIQIEDTDFIVTIKEITTKPEKVAPGQPVDLSFVLENHATSKITDLRVSLTLEKSDGTELPFSPIGTTDELVVKTLSPGKNTVVTFPLAVDANAESKVHKIPAIITYKNKDGDTFTKDVTVGVPVFEEPSYLVNLENTQIYKTSQKGHVVVSISNTGVTQMKFLTLELLPSDDYDIISPTKIYLGNLDSDDFETADFDLFMHSDKEEVPLQLSLVYNDEYNNKYETRSSSVKVHIYTADKAVKYGLEQPKSYINSIIGILVLVLITIFWVAMLVDVARVKKKGFQKTIWVITVFLTYILGAVLYYFIGRKQLKK